MKFCKKCGKLNEGSNQLFCVSCGASLIDDDTNDLLSSDIEVDETLNNLSFDNIDDISDFTPQDNNSSFNQDFNNTFDDINKNKDSMDEVYPNLDKNIYVGLGKDLNNKASNNEDIKEDIKDNQANKDNQKFSSHISNDDYVKHTSHEAYDNTNLNNTNTNVGKKKKSILRTISIIGIVLIFALPILFGLFNSIHIVDANNAEVVYGTVVNSTEESYSSYDFDTESYVNKYRYRNKVRYTYEGLGYYYITYISTSSELGKEVAVYITDHDPSNARLTPYSGAMDNLFAVLTIVIFVAIYGGVIATFIVIGVKIEKRKK